MKSFKFFSFVVDLDLIRDSCYLLAGEASIDRYCKFLLHDQPKNILGMGVYSYPSDSIRVIPSLNTISIYSLPNLMILTMKLY